MTAAAYLFTDPRARPLDANGNIMPGCYMQFYASGTTTPADVYSDADLTTPLSNPVVSDSAGRFPVIYLDPHTTYRVQLYDADDVLIYDVDPYAPPRDYPPGTVVWFHGTEEDRDAVYPPALWQVLNGSNGTPDGRDRFVVIAGGSLQSGDTGGSASPTTSAAGAHDHGGETGGTAITVDQMPAHGHNLLGATGAGITDTVVSSLSAVGVGASRNASAGPYSEGTVSTGDPWIEETGDDQEHSHSIDAVGDHTHTVSVTPPYVALWALMRRAV